MKIKSLYHFASVTFVMAASHQTLHALDNSFSNVTPASDYATATNWSLSAVPVGTDNALIGNFVTRSAVYDSATSFTTTGRFLTGLGGGSTGSLTMGSSAGTLTYGGDGGAVSNFIGVDGGTGSLTMNGGTFKVIGNTDVPATAGTGYLRIGANSGTGTVTVNAGLLDIGHSANVGARFNNADAAASSIGTLTVTGTGQVIVGSGTNVTNAGGSNGFLYLKNNFATSSGTATVNLDGGTLTAKRIVAGTGGGTKTINFNGGTLIAGATDANFLAAASEFTANVNNGGAKIDTQAFNVTVGAALVTNGTGGLTKSGSGILTLTGTNTYTGNTTINAGTLTFNSTADQTLSGNLSGAGALTKNGIGVLTLAGTDNSLYTGNTTITAGTLAFSGGNDRLSTTGNITIGATGTLDLGANTQTTTGVVTFANGATLKGGTLTSNNAATGGNNFLTGTINLGAGGAFVSNKRLLLGNTNTGALTIGTGSTGSITFGGDNSIAMNYVGVGAPAGAAGNGTLTVNGGTVNFNNASFPGTGNGYLNVGSNSNSLTPSTGSIVVNGGNINVGTWLKLGGNFSNIAGTDATSSLAISTGTVTVGGGSDATSNGVLFMNGGAGDNTANIGTSTLTLNTGGVLNVKQIQAGNLGTKTINFDGGTLRAGASSINFLNAATGLTLNVQNGGAAIDTQAFDVTVGAALVTNGTGGLTKSGAGILTLSGANTYTGDTTVDAGTLSLSQAFLENTSDVAISSTATLDLQFGATDTVEKLFINGVQQASGTWGAVGNVTAAHTTPRITGGGLLNVTSAPSAGYAGWASGFFPAFTNTAADLDFENDGLDSGIEWVVGGNPTLNDAASVAPTFNNTSSPSNFLFTFRRRDSAAADPNTTIIVEYSSSLTGWTAAQNGVNGVTIDATTDLGGGFHQVTVAIPRTLSAGSGKLFARLRVAVVTP